MPKLVLLCLAVLGLCRPALSATVTCKDGRVLKGEILEEKDGGVVLDTKVGSIRGTIRVAKEEIAEVDRAPLPADYWSDEPAGEARVEGAVPYAPGSQRYLVVPIKGKFGADVLEAALSQVLSYAWRNKVGHLVFEIDSAGSNDLDEARAVFRLLGKYAERIQFHAWVKQATGDSLAVLLQAHTIHVAPGARIGGAPFSAETEKSEEMMALRAAMGERAVAISRERGRPGLLVRAMLDPRVGLACWLDDQGRPASGAAAPKEVPAERVVVRCAEGELLVVSGEQLAKLGVPAFEGDAAALGKVLELSGWQAESQYGVKTMERVASATQAAADKAATRHERELEKYLRRREALLDGLRHALAKAEEWDPEKGEYATYKRSYTWAWGNYGAYGQDSETNQLTKDSRLEWQLRTDNAIRYIQDALRASRSLRSVEKQAAKLGVEAAVDPAELERLETDLKRRGVKLQEQRDRKER